MACRGRCSGMADQQPKRTDNNAMVISTPADNNCTSLCEHFEIVVDDYFAFWLTRGLWSVALCRFVLVGGCAWKYLCVWLAKTTLRESQDWLESTKVASESKIRFLVHNSIKTEYAESPHISHTYTSSMMWKILWGDHHRHIDHWINGQRKK